MQGLERGVSSLIGFRVQERIIGEHRVLGFFMSQSLLPNIFVLRKKVTFKLKGHNCPREAPGPFLLGWVLRISIRKPQFPATGTPPGLRQQIQTLSQDAKQLASPGRTCF